MKSLAKKVKKMRFIRKSEINVDFIFKEHVLQEKMTQLKLYGPNSPLGYGSLTEEDHSIVDSSNKEASNHYEFYRILSQENYDLGKSIRDFTDNFKEKNKNLSEAVENLPKQMEELLKFIDECVNTFYCYFNFGKSNTEKMLPYCRPAVEKFIFGKINNLLCNIYNKKYDQENKKFMINQNNIKIKMTPFQIMAALDIKKEFMEIDENDTILPYRSTIDSINKVEYESTPKDKFDTLMKASLELRNCILDITKGKVFIYINSSRN